MPPLVSVVTPFYNTEAYLEECIESVLAQTYPHFEYVLLNNCSTDRSLEIARRYVERDSRLRLFHNERLLPQIQNYNQSLRHISRECRYVKMVQADDAVFPRCLADMVEMAEAHPSVGVVSSYRTLGRTIWPNGLSFHKTVMSGREACRLCLIDDLSLFGSQTTVMVRADLVRARDPFYAEGRPFPDSDVVYQVLRGSDFAFVHQVLSFTRLEDDSTWDRTLGYGPLVLDRLLRLHSFGPYYLSPEECARYVSEQERVYRRFLAKAWLSHREPGFWEFHRKGLASIGEEIDKADLLPQVLPVILYYLIRPEEVASALLRRMRGRAAKDHTV